MPQTLPVDREHRKVIFCASQNPGGIMALFVEQLIIYVTSQIRELSGAAISFFFYSFPSPGLYFISFPSVTLSSFLVFGWLIVVCFVGVFPPPGHYLFSLLCSDPSVSFIESDVLVPSVSQLLSQAAAFPIFDPSPYIVFCFYLLFSPSLTPFFNPLLLTLFLVSVCVYTHRPMCSYLQSFPHGVCSKKYQ